MVGFKRQPFNSIGGLIRLIRTVRHRCFAALTAVVLLLWRTDQHDNIRQILFPVAVPLDLGIPPIGSRPSLGRLIGSTLFYHWRPSIAFNRKCYTEQRGAAVDPVRSCHATLRLRSQKRERCSNTRLAACNPLSSDQNRSIESFLTSFSASPSIFFSPQPCGYRLTLRQRQKKKIQTFLFDLIYSTVGS